MEHKEIPSGQMHRPHNWVVADRSALDGISVTPDDIGKYAWQSDSGYEWVLKSAEPVVWRACSVTDLYANEITGRAAVGDGQVFRVQGSGEVVAHEYRRVNENSSLLIASYPSAESVTRPKWAGKLQLWPDPFFRFAGYLETDQILGATRWWGGYTSWTIAPNSKFDGGQLSKVGNANLGGPVLGLDGVDVGEKITVSVLVIGSGAIARFPARFVDASGNWMLSQIDGTSDAGSKDVVTSNTPTRITIETTVPVGAAELRLYPVSTVAGGAFDIIALWSFRGEKASGPAWPILPDPDGTKYKLAATQTVVDTLSASVAAHGAAIVENTEAVSYVVDSYGVVTATATSVEVAALFTSGFPRDLVFRGWGERYSPVGVSFNAIRCKAIARTAALESSRWRTIRVIVRTGAASASAGAPIVAVGSTKVLESSDAITDLVVLLRDPATGAVKTLTDADFFGGEYFVGIYAENSAGAPASCGEPRGTMSNSLGQSYYITTNHSDPKISSWMPASPGANARLGFEHLLLTEPVEQTDFQASQKMVNDVGAAMTMPAPEIVMPPFVFGVEGRECNVYLDNLHLTAAADYLHDVTSASNSGQHQNERWTWMPAGTMTAGVLTVAVYDKRTGKLLTSKTAQQRAAAAAAGSGANKKVLVIGDSLVQAGTITQTLLDIAAVDVMGITLYGTQGTAPNRHEGRGGWTVNDYTTSGRTYYQFTVSGVVTAPAINSTEYSHNGSVYRVQSYSLSAGSGTITCSVTSGGAPMASGTLTKSNGGAGDATIAFSSSTAVPGNPFWIGGALNFGQYLANNSIPAPDWCIIALGINDCFGQTDDFACSAFSDSSLTKLDALIGSIKAADVNTKIGLVLPSPPSADQDAFGFNYTTGQTRWRFKRNILIWSRQMIAKYAAQEGNRIYIVPSNAALDTVNNMSRAAPAPVNSRNIEVQISRQNNGVHPAVSGYRQIADAVWAFLKFHAAL